MEGNSEENGADRALVCLEPSSLATKFWILSDHSGYPVLQKGSDELAQVICMLTVCIGVYMVDAYTHTALNGYLKERSSASS